MYVMRDISQLKIELINLRKSNHSLNHCFNELRQENIHIKKENKNIKCDIRDIKSKYNEFVTTNMISFQELKCNFQNEQLDVNMRIIVNDNYITKAICVNDFNKQR